MLGAGSFSSSSLDQQGLSVHVRIRETAHKGIRANHLFRAHPRRELGVPVAKLVHVDRYYAGVIVELDEPLQAMYSLIWIPWIW